MSKQTIVIEKCDICGKEVSTKSCIVPVRWFTEQTEGRMVKPYIKSETLDICNECFEKLIVVSATGAQGYNTFKIRE